MKQNLHPLAQQLIEEFKKATSLDVQLPNEYIEPINGICIYLETMSIRPLYDRVSDLFTNINYKFRFNATGINDFYSSCASKGITFNYHEKKQIQLAFDSISEELFIKLLENKIDNPVVKKQVTTHFSPLTTEETIHRLLEEIESPTFLRNRDLYQKDEVILSLFASFVFFTSDIETMHRLFNQRYKIHTYEPNFLDQLRAWTPSLFDRNRTLDILIIDENHTDRNDLFPFIEESYDNLNNHGFLAIYIKPIVYNEKRLHWEIASDITLFAEKHKDSLLKKSYFKPILIETQTKSYVKNIDLQKANFALANEGFTYRDCFIIYNDQISNVAEEPGLLLIFQKNKRDETIVPCPACRSENVQGNSYSSLGVRSWECKNLFCSDKSKLNRGKRYSFRSILMQEAIEDERNQISESMIKKWQRDILNSISLSESIEMVIKFYSIHGDGVYVYNYNNFFTDDFNRRISYSQIRPNISNKISDGFFENAIFSRYIVDRHSKICRHENMSYDDNFKVICGDAFEVLSNVEANYFDGCVTSPPYYNAREYSTWNNIYCYLYDIYNISKEIYRVLKPGALFLYNIFDYFDNERSIVFSDMGQKRMILSSYSVDIFRRIGFNLLTNIPWDKGEIEGKRAFNGGNNSPYYQAPFNCWEHILVLQKPSLIVEAGSSLSTQLLPKQLRAKPVVKIMKGKNLYGHTAPFPEDLPKLLIDILPKNSIILDPFAGSCTTGRVAYRNGVRSVNIDIHENYCQLGINYWKSSNRKQFSDILVEEMQDNTIEQLRLFERRNKIL